MTTSTSRPPTTFSAIFQWRSLKTRVTFSTLTIFLVGIWLLAFYSSYTLQNDMKQALGEQQFSTASIIASDINDALDDRLKSLEMLAAMITPAMMGNAASMQKFLECHVTFQRFFNYGGIVLRLDGLAIAEVPNHGRIGINYHDRDYMIEVLKGKTTISKTVMGKTSCSPFFSMLTPIRDTKGKVIGVLAGATDLSKHNFLNNITDNRYGKTGGYLLVSPKIRTIVFATDKKRIMEALPGPGKMPFYDRAIEGWEGSGVTRNPLGVEVLSSIKGIPVSGWYLVATMPTEEAFAPAHAMQKRMLLAAIFLTLLAGGLTWWMLKRQLAPVFTTIKTLAAMSDTDQPPQPLPITRQDEIGELIGGFNLLLETLGQREEALKESEEKYRLIVENANEALYVLQDGIFRYANGMCGEMLGIPVAELIGLSMLEFLNPDDREKTVSKHLRILRGELAAGRTDFRILTRHGEERWADVNSVVIAWGGKTATLNFATDITDRKCAEEERRRLEERLQRSEKMESLGLLAGGVAHDLNNVLGIVVGYAEMLLMAADKSSSIRPSLVNIMNGGQKAAAIVEDLLTLARRGVSDRDVLNLNKIIADCQQSPEFEKLYSYHPSVKIKTDLEPDLTNISGSSVHLDKTIFNLVSNACEAMAKGGLVTIKTTNQYLDKPIQGYDQIRGGDYVVLSVSDTGEGIPAADLRRIFEPFYTKKVMGRSGTGLGLAVVWGAVKDHHGYINVESEEGKGSAFTLYFPVTREDITADAVAVAISEYMGNGESILIVDDVKEQRDLAAGMLRTLNYNVSRVSSGEEAVAYMKEHKVDLMVLDMIMDPGIDGLDTYKSVLEIYPQQKAIIVSGFSETDRVKAAKALGAGAYVRKPYVIEKLGLAVRNELDRPA